MKSILIILLLLYISLSAQQKWEKLNGPIGGTIASISAKGDTIIAGTGFDHGLIFYSTNKGQQWERANIKVPQRFSRIVFANDGGIIATALLGEIYKSFDLMNWSLIYQNSPEEFWSLGKDKYGFIYAGTESGKILISTNNGLLWSVDFQTTKRINDFHITKNMQLFAGGIDKILIKTSLSSWQIIPNDSLNLIYIFSDNQTGNIFAQDNARLFISTDLGITWLRQDPNGFLLTTFIRRMIYNNRIIAGCSPNEFQPGWGILLSDDFGETWRYTYIGLPLKISSTGPFTKSGDDTFAGSWAAGVFKSTDYGESWSPLNNGLTAARTRDLCFDAEGVMYTANFSNGFQKSTDKGESWTVINNGLSNVNCYSIISDDNGVLFGGTNQGMFLSTDKGNNWTAVTGNAGNNYAYNLYKDHLNRIYALTYGTGVYRTTNLGESWQRIDNFASGYTFGFTSDTTGLMLAGTRGSRIYRSTNYGATWSQVYYNNTFNSVVGEITAIKGDTIFATNHFVGILRSTDKGLSWQLKKEDTGWQFTYPAVFTDEGEYASGSGDKLYFSSDNGDIWNDVTDNLSLTSFFKIREHKNRIYFATDESVWRSTLFSTAVNDGQENISEYQLYQNYPNPFNPTTKISYSLKDEGYVKLLIYDIKGELISTLVNESQQPGKYEVEFTDQGNKLSSGVYIYRIVVNDRNNTPVYSDVKKMVYLK